MQSSRCYCKGKETLGETRILPNCFIQKFIISVHIPLVRTSHSAPHRSREVWNVSLVGHLLPSMHSILWKGAWIFGGQPVNSATDVNPTHVAQRERNGVSVGEATNHVNRTREPGPDVRQALICAEADVWALHSLLDWLMWLTVYYYFKISSEILLSH